MVVYVDVLILENFIVNYFLLIITSQTLCIKANNKRMLLSSIIAAFYTLVLFVDILDFMTLLPVKIIVALFLVYLAFGWNNDIIFLLKGTFVYILYTFVLAGIIIFLEYRNLGSPAQGLVISDFSSKKLILTLIISYILIHRIFSYIINRQKLQSYTYNIEIITKNVSVKVKALLDTGNELKEPITNLPVIIVEKNAFKGLDFSSYDKLYIPYKVVSGESDYLEAFKPDGVRIGFGPKRTQLRNAVIGISDIKLSQHDEYQALLSRDII